MHKKKQCTLCSRVTENERLYKQITHKVMLRRIKKHQWIWNLIEKNSINRDDVDSLLLLQPRQLLPGIEEFINKIMKKHCTRTETKHSKTTIFCKTILYSLFSTIASARCNITDCKTLHSSENHFTGSITPITTMVIKSWKWCEKKGRERTNQLSGDDMCK